ncbi:MAG: glycosyltransferase family 9 protein [Ignavibacteria bacterium]|nr:glycosyltransferase family 9 protein [Ignavibacteria bacterium]
MINKERVKKIAIVKLCCLGDIVFITPTVKNLKYNFPESEIVLIVSDWVKDVASLIPSTDRFIIYNPPARDSSLIKKLIDAIKLIRMLRKEKFDLAFLGHRTSYLGFIIFLGGIKYRLGFNKTKFINHGAEFIENLHETKRYLKILESNNLIIQYENTELLRLSKEKSENGKLILGIYPFGGVNPGTKMEIKRWELNKYFELRELLNKDFPDIEITFFEGKTESEKLTDYKNIKGLVIKNIDLKLLSNCDIFLSGDTGVLHIAAAMGISTLGIFGPSSPECVAPMNYEDSEKRSLNLYIWKKIECSPCYTPSTAIDRKNKKYWRENNFICYKGTNECIKSITVEEVFFELKKIIDFLRLKSQ